MPVTVTGMVFVTFIGRWIGAGILMAFSGAAPLAETISLADLNMRAWALSEDGSKLVMSITPPETAKTPRLLISTDDSFRTYRQLDFPAERVVIGIDFSRDGKTLALATLCVDASCGPLNASSVIAEYDLATGQLTDLTQPMKGLLKWKPHYAVDGELYFGMTEMEGNSLARSLALAMQPLPGWIGKAGPNRLSFPLRRR